MKATASRLKSAAPSVAALAVMLTAAWGASLLAPKHGAAGSEAALEHLVPRSFGDWEEVMNPVSQITLNPRIENEPAGAEAYDDLLMRTYRRTDGEHVMVTIAYGRKQTQERKIHRPELCYYAQGFDVRALGRRFIPLSSSQSVSSLALLTRNRSRTEVVTYWMRIGERITENAWETRWTILREGLAGRIPDGLLVRASTLASSEAATERELALQHTFLTDLYAAVPRSTQRLFTGT